MRVATSPYRASIHAAPASCLGRLADGVLRPLPRVDGKAEGLAVVVLVDGGARLLHARGGGGVFLGRELLGAGGAGEIDGGLRLIDFFPGRLGAARDEEQQAGDRQSQQHDPRPNERNRRGQRRTRAHGGQSIAAG